MLTNKDSTSVVVPSINEYQTELLHMLKLKVKTVIGSANMTVEVYPILFACTCEEFQSEDTSAIFFVSAPRPGFLS